jgi:hypothetical protein
MVATQAAAYHPFQG